MGLCVLPFGPQPPWAMPHISAGYLKVPSSKKAIPQQLKNHKSGPTVHCKMGKWRRERTALRIISSQGENLVIIPLITIANTHTGADTGSTVRTAGGMVPICFPDSTLVGGPLLHRIWA